MSGVTIRFSGLDGLRHGGAAFGTAVEREVFLFANESLKGELQQRLPIGATGNLRLGISAEQSGSGLQTAVRLFPQAGYAPFVEFGRGPGPISEAGMISLGDWARRKGLSDHLYAIAASIRKHGTRRRRMQESGEWAKLLEELPARFEAARAGIQERLTAALQGGV